MSAVTSHGSNYWDFCYAMFMAHKGLPRMDVVVGSRAEALALMSAERGKEFAEVYPQ